METMINLILLLLLFFIGVMGLMALGFLLFMFVTRTYPSPNSTMIKDSVLYLLPHIILSPFILLNELLHMLIINIIRLFKARYFWSGFLLTGISLSIITTIYLLSHDGLRIILIMWSVYVAILIIYDLITVKYETLNTEEPEKEIKVKSEEEIEYLTDFA